MKKIFTLALKKTLALVALLVSQVRAWAADTTTASTIDNSENIFTQPWIWIGVIVTVVITLLGPFTHEKEEFAVIRKKDFRRKSL